MMDVGSSSWMASTRSSTPGGSSARHGSSTCAKADCNHWCSIYQQRLCRDTGFENAAIWCNWPESVGRRSACALAAATAALSGFVDRHVLALPDASGMVPAAADCGAPPAPPRPAAIRRSAASASGRGIDWMDPRPSDAGRGGEGSAGGSCAVGGDCACVVTTGASTALVLIAGRGSALRAICSKSGAGGSTAAAPGAPDSAEGRCSRLVARSRVALHKNTDVL